MNVDQGGSTHHAILEGIPAILHLLATGMVGSPFPEPLKLIKSFTIPDFFQYKVRTFPY